MSLRSLVYFVLSVVVGVVGLALLFASKSSPPAPGANPGVYEPVLLSIGTSLIAAGATSLLFTIVREIDQRDATEASQRIDSLVNLEQDLRKGLTELRRLLFVTRNPDARRIYNVHPVQEVRQEIRDVAERVRLDALGLALKALYEEQVKGLIERGNAEVRLLVEDPRSEAFAIMCEQEARDRLAMMRDALAVTEAVRRWGDQHGNAVDQDVRVLIRWSRLHVPVTITRVNDWMAVRPRFPLERSGELAFFEQYTSDDERAFDQLVRFFEKIWDHSEEPTGEDVEDARGLLDALSKANNSATKQ